MPSPRVFSWIALAVSTLAASIGPVAVLGLQSPAGATTCSSYEVLIAHADGAVSVYAPTPAACTVDVFQGDMKGTPLNQPIVGMAPTPDGGGYWLVAADGGIFAFGDAQFYGSMGGQHLNAPIVGMAPTPDGGGYWLVAADGGLFAFGDAAFHGSMGATALNKPVVGMAPDAVTGGYWLVASDGGIFAFDAPFYGSMGGQPLNAPVSFMTGTTTGNGYRMVASDGGVFNFGDAQFYGSAAAGGSSGWSALTSTVDGGGYWLLAPNGSAVDVDAFGDASTALSPGPSSDSSAAAVVGAATLNLLTNGIPPETPTPSAGGTFSAVTCLSSTRCLAVGKDASGQAGLIERSDDGGATFQNVGVPSGLPALAAVTCSDTRHCLAVGGSSIALSADGGQTWATETAGRNLTAVGCENVNICVAVGWGGGNYTQIFTANGGGSWVSSSPTLYDPLQGVTCTSTLCIAVGAALGVSTDGGSSWQQKGAALGIPALYSAACLPGTSTCVGVGPNSAGIGSPTAPGDLVVSTDGAVTWTNDTTNMAPSTSPLYSVSCPTSTTCYAAGPPLSGSSTSVFASTTTGGASWTAGTGPTGLSSASGVWCTSSTTCLVVGASSAGPVVTRTTNNGGSWSSSPIG